MSYISKRRNPVGSIVHRAKKYVSIEYPVRDSREEEGFPKNCPICTCGTIQNPAICINPESRYIKEASDKMIAFLISHEQAHLKYGECRGDEPCAAIRAKDFLKNITDEEFEELLVKWFVKYRSDALNLPSSRDSLISFVNILMKHIDKIPPYLAREVKSVYNSIKEW